MGWYGVALAMLLPWIAGTLWVRLLWNQPAAGVWPLALGYGYLLAMLGVTLMLRGLAAIGLPLGPILPLAFFTLVALAGAWMLRRRAGRSQPRSSRTGAGQSIWHWLLLGLLFILLGARLLGLAFEVFWHPLFAWDAWTTWGFRARAWAELQALVPFVSPLDWLRDSADGAYTIAAWQYPDTVSLIALWSVLGFGGWSEPAANLPWLGCAFALALGFHGQSKLWGCSPLVGMVFLWGLFSLPILDTHIALAGYADLWMATSLGLAAIAFFQWARTGDWRQMILAILMIAGCVAIKDEGGVWAMIFLPALFAARLSGKPLLTLVVVLPVVALWMTGGVAFELPVLGPIALRPELIQVPYLGRFELAYHNSWPAIGRHLFVYDSWHLLGYLALVACVWGSVLVFRSDAESWLRAEMAFVLVSFLALFVLFFMTEAYRWAESATSINRLLLHFVPAYAFWMMTLWSRYSTGLVSATPLADSGGAARS